MRRMRPMFRMWSAVLASTAIGLLSVSANAAPFKGGGGGGGGGAVAAPHFSAPAAMPHFSAPAPHFSMPQSHFAAPHFSAPAMRSVTHFSSAPHFQSHIATSHIATPHVATAHTEALRELRTQQRVDRLEQRAQTGHLTGREQKQLNTLHDQQAHQQQLREQTPQKLQEQQKLRDQNAQKPQEDQKLREQNAQKLQEGQKLK